MYRVGRFEANQNSGERSKPRPLKICLFNKHERDSLMRNLVKLKTSTDPKLIKMYAMYDLSVSVRQLVEEKTLDAQNKSNDQVF